MAQFDESKVINALHTDKAEVGKKYWYADNITKLKRYIEQDCRTMSGELKATQDDLFKIGTGCYYLLYPYEEPPKKRMTYRQLAEWCAKGNGENILKGSQYVHISFAYLNKYENDELEEGYLIRTWDSEEWIEPTVDIYERDCKGDRE